MMKQVWGLTGTSKGMNGGVFIKRGNWKKTGFQREDHEFELRCVEFMCL